jgi:hypothetical protein
MGDPEAVTSDGQKDTETGGLVNTVIDGCLEKLYIAETAYACLLAVVGDGRTLSRSTAFRRRQG